MKVPLLDLTAQQKTIDVELKEAVIKVLDSSKYILGEVVESLEKEIALYSGSKYGIGVSSGTDAILLSLMALDCKPGDVVITTDFSFFATAGCIVRAGATPVFIDIDPRTFNISTKSLENWFSKNQDKIGKVKAIIPVHLFGQCADMDPIIKLADKYSISVIEDAAQAIGSIYPSEKREYKAGSLGLCGCFSFFPSKNLGGIGDGGMIVTSNKEFADKLRCLRNHGATKMYEHTYIGGNFRLDAIQAAALLVKLRHLDKWSAGRRLNAATYNKELADTGIETPFCLYDSNCHIYNQYTILTQDRDRLKNFLDSKEIGSQIYYPLAFHQQKCFENLFANTDSEYSKDEYAISEETTKRCLSLPVYPELTTDMKTYLLTTIKEFFNKK